MKYFAYQTEKKVIEKTKKVKKLLVKTENFLSEGNFRCVNDDNDR